MLASFSRFLFNRQSCSSNNHNNNTSNSRYRDNNSTNSCCNSCNNIQGNSRNTSSNRHHTTNLSASQLRLQSLRWFLILLLMLSKYQIKLNKLSVRHSNSHSKLLVLPNRHIRLLANRHIRLLVRLCNNRLSTISSRLSATSSIS